MQFESECISLFTFTYLDFKVAAKQQILSYCIFATTPSSRVVTSANGHAASNCRRSSNTLPLIRVVWTVLSIPLVVIPVEETLFELIGFYSLLNFLRVPPGIGRVLFKVLNNC